MPPTMILLLSLFLIEPRQYSTEVLVEDLNALKRALEREHAGLNNYVSKQEIDNAFASLKRELGPMDELGFFGKILPLMALIGDGHTQLSLSDTTTRRLDELAVRLPVKLFVTGDEAFIQRDYSQGSVFPLGSQVTAINGMSMEEIIHRMLPLFTSDGQNLTLKYRFMGSSWWFGTRLRLFLGEVDSFRFDIRERGGDGRRSIEHPGLTREQVERAYQARYASEDRDLSVTRLRFEDDLAILRLPSFQDSRLNGQSFEAFFSGSFARIQQAEVNHLIIDLRGNGGGYDAPGRILLQHLASAPFEYYKDLRRADGGSVGHPNLGIHQPKAPGFRGKVFVFMDGGSFSAASEFISVAHHLKLATFIGEEPSGGYTGNTSGTTGMETLPNTKIRVYIPKVRYLLAVEEDERYRQGLVPDVRMVPSIDDLLEKRDPALEWVRTWVSKKKDESL